MPNIYYTAAGGVVVNGGKILLLRRPVRGEIRLPKGHVEPNEPLQMAALREVGEESGYVDVEIVADLGEQLVEFDGRDAHVVRTEFYYLMSLRSPRQVERDPFEHQFEPIWVDWADALAQLSFEPEREWVRRAQQANLARA